MLIIGKNTIYLVFHQSSQCQFCFTHITGAIFFRTLQPWQGLDKWLEEKIDAFVARNMWLGRLASIFWRYPMGKSYEITEYLWVIHRIFEYIDIFFDKPWWRQTWVYSWYNWIKKHIQHLDLDIAISVVSMSRSMSMLGFRWWFNPKYGRLNPRIMLLSRRNGWLYIHRTNGIRIHLDELSPVYNILTPIIIYI